ncbi:hypothetical protein PHMEG_00017528 [Phytophthora megakarya]|uniref:Uncharacterized protein n=1 Tax=Phytophthora megakarya TaxID=4795 RepID=A0A225VWC5_9STRA|nr:hypothetical protein PHMEG_00017528 [Phytophthora megakarya]
MAEQQKDYRLLISRTRRIIISSDVQNIDKLDVCEKETSDVLNMLNEKNWRRQHLLVAHAATSAPRFSTL